MPVSRWKSAGIAAGALAGIALFLSAAPEPPTLQASQASAQEIVLKLDAAQSKVRYGVDATLHTVHGTFNLKSGTVQFDPESGRAGGEVNVYATSGESGNSSRDQKMHKEILETHKYPDITFRPTQVEGTVARSGSSDVKLRGVMLVHGSEHEIVVPVHAEFTGDRWNATAKLDVPYIQWGMKDASNWLLKVKPVVHIEVELVGTAKGPN